MCEGIARLGVVDIQIPCTDSLAIRPVLTSSGGLQEYDLDLHLGTPVFRSGVIRTEPGSCDPLVLLGLSDSNIEMGDPVLLSWRLDRVHACKAVGDWEATIEGDGGVYVRVTETSEFGLECLSDEDDQLVETSVTVEVFAPPVTHIRFDQPRVLPGEAATVRWVSENAAICFATLSATPIHAVEVTGNETFRLVPRSGATLAELLCDGEAGLDFIYSFAHIATSAQATSLDVEVDRLSILEGEAVTVSWQSENASSCWVELTEVRLGDRGESEHFDVATSGSLELTPRPTFTPRFEIDVSRDDASSRTSIIARPLPAVELTAEFTEVNAGEPVTLSWSSIDTQHCVALGAWSGELLMSGNLVVAPLTDSVYEIGCAPRTRRDASSSGAFFATHAEAEMVRDSVTVRVIPEPGRVLLQGVALLVTGLLLRRHRRATQQ